ncbi:uncharacterized protein PHACADRAFT_128404 [Phanerochaete carnosa HHB-10118-sp]|uniref:Glucose-methanol-choline oxidoreductase N-terminal domain-containing protein n=1 Tax=Phanerochaete carnosa (strain HHB-10118-sp) TaxID=650164 RepID=K5VZB7_PHACS|nr:uncharacterized protein PHACADRAFT_128404 [Phanerochaete carnosa HHB-10118-sp]EKM52185.1 hypothetical protein PHACADRAFT_128404 [Phanerochaete carnosa HHB-10118-sp]
MSIANLQDVANKAFDYIIIGAGSAGLTLAARLSEDPAITVLVLEAGNANLEDPELLTPAKFSRHFGNTLYDWGHVTTKQRLFADKVMPWARGKGLGGSSTINFMVWTKPSAEEINAVSSSLPSDIERLGNPGWNWESYQKYSAKVENFIAPPEDQRMKFNLPLYEGVVGRDGCYYPLVMQYCVINMLRMFENAGLPEAPQPYGGDLTGYFVPLNSHDCRTATRSSAATAYYMPVKDRANLTILTQALASKVVFSGSDHDQNLVATGVEFVYGGQSYVAHSVREVIISAGTIKSPQILELSGIGRREILESARVQTKVNLPGVGENLQEHTMVSMYFLLKEGYDFPTFDGLRDEETMLEQLELYKAKEGAFTMGNANLCFLPVSTVSPRAAEIYAKAKAAVTQLDVESAPAGLLEQYKIQLERIRPGSSSVSPVCEFIGMPGMFYGGIRRCTYGACGITHTEAVYSAGFIKGRKYLSATAGSNTCFSRGTVHVVSPDPMNDPEIDPKYFEHDVDQDILLDTVKLLRKLPLETAPLKDMVEREFMPGPEVVSDEQLLGRIHIRFLRQLGVSLMLSKLVYVIIDKNWIDSCGTCSMTPRDKGGVVNHHLKVYGTANLRVVDLSIVPLNFTGHSQGATP